MTATVHLLANPQARAGGAAAEVATTARVLRDRGLTVVDLAAADAPEVEALARAAVAEGAERLVVVGGDGMVHLAIQAVAGTPTVLGLVPSGSGNDFARGVGVPTERPAAIEAALDEPAPVDLMRIGDRWAASVATAGFSVDVNARANAMRWPSGGSRYTIATLRELPRLAARRFELRIDEEPLAVPATLVTVANTSNFGGGMRITPGADPTDGVLDVTVVGAVGRVELLRWFRTVFSGTHLEHPKVTTYRGRRITIAAPRTEVWADGEPVARAPATIEVAPGALRLAGGPTLAG